MTRRRRSAAVAVALAAVAVAGCSGGSDNPTVATPSTTPVQHPTSSGASSFPAVPTPAATYTAPPQKLPVVDIPLSEDDPPWLPPAIIDNGADSAAYVAAAGLPYAEEMLKVHYHAHLDIRANGEKVTVPAYLGFVATGDKVAGLAPLHTHDDSGVIHVENSVPAKFLLGQVFVEWGVRFTPTCLGPFCSGNGNELAVFVDGKRYTGDPTRLVLASHQEIAVEFGDAGDLATPPSSYDFPAGE